MSEPLFFVLVHGTFGGARSDTVQWYQLDDRQPRNFCGQLREQLRARGYADVPFIQVNESEADSTSHRAAPLQIPEAVAGSRCCIIAYTWSGDNEHGARTRAGYALTDLITQVEAAYPEARLHFIAHSHGGNVVLKALEYWLVKYLKVPRPDHFSLRWLMQTHDYGSPSRWGVYPRIVPRRKAKRGETGWSLRDPRTEHRDDDLNLWRALHGEGRSGQIGRIVFLGTPFIEKQWKKGVLSAHERVEQIVNIFVDALNLAALVLVPVLLVWLLVAGLWMAGSIPTLDWSPLPWTWHWAVAVPFVLITAYLAYLTVKHRFREDWVPIKNVYCDELAFGPQLLELANRLWRKDLGGADMRLPSLIIHTGLLDEALLGLSSEPIVYGLLAPQIDRLFESAKSDRSAPADASQFIRFLTRKLRDWTSRQVGRSMRLLRFGWIGAGLRALWSKITRWAIGGYLKNSILKVVSSAALGFPPSEFARARFLVKHRIDAPHLFRAWEWNVASVLEGNAGAGQDLVEVRNAARGGGRYAFLHSDIALDERLSRSKLWEAIAGQPGVGGKDRLEELRARYEGYAGLARDGLPGDLRRVAVAVEHRVEDVVVAMSHGRYYSSPEIVSGVAGFLLDDAVPAGAVESSSLIFSFRAQVCKSVVEGKEPVRYLYREAPAHELDSGWRIVNDRKDEQLFEVHLADVVWLDHHIEALLDAPVGSAFDRSSDGLSYVAAGAKSVLASG